MAVSKKRIEEAMKLQGLNKEKLVEKLADYMPTKSQNERDLLVDNLLNPEESYSVANMRVSTLITLSQALGVTMEYLCEIENTKPLEQNICPISEEEQEKVKFIENELKAVIMAIDKDVTGVTTCLETKTTLTKMVINYEKMETERDIYLEDFTLPEILEEVAKIF